MSPEFVVEIGRKSVETILLVGSPMLLSGLIVGLLVSIFQAATQINEQTLSFAPKIVAVLVSLIIFAPWIIKIILAYTEGVYQILSVTGAGG